MATKLWIIPIILLVAIIFASGCTSHKSASTPSANTELQSKYEFDVSTLPDSQNYHVFYNSTNYSSLGVTGLLMFHETILRRTDTIDPAVKDVPIRIIASVITTASINDANSEYDALLFKNKQASPSLFTITEFNPQIGDRSSGLIFTPTANLEGNLMTFDILFTSGDLVAEVKVMEHPGSTLTSVPINMAQQFAEQIK
jgi:hypothetical protein